MKTGADSISWLNRGVIWSLGCAVILSLGLSNSQALTQAQEPEASEIQPTHEQTKVIRVSDPEHKSAKLNSFCVDRQGNLLTAVTSGVLRFDPDGELIKAYRLDFAPDAICQAEDGSIFVGGGGKLARLAETGEVVSQMDIPWLQDKATLRKEARKLAKAQLEQLTKNSNQAIENIKKRIAELEDQEELTERDEQRLQAMNNQLSTLSRSQKSLKMRYESPQFIEQSIARRSKIISIAANDRDVFVSTSGAQFGYDIYRVDQKLENPKRVSENLGGCCGNCHIFASKQHLMIAANTKFSVVLTDRDGKEINKFGERGGSKGFEGCCNPMNLCSASDGTILTAESGGGVIKRYSRKGELLALIGKAKVAAGCKNVAIGYDAKLDRYYMQNIASSEICVLEPLSKAVSPELSTNHDAAGQK